MELIRHIQAAIRYIRPSPLDEIKWGFSSKWYRITDRYISPDFALAGEEEAEGRTLMSKEGEKRRRDRRRCAKDVEVHIRKLCDLIFSLKNPTGRRWISFVQVWSVGFPFFFFPFSFVWGHQSKLTCDIHRMNQSINQRSARASHRLLNAYLHGAPACCVSRYLVLYSRCLHLPVRPTSLIDISSSCCQHCSLHDSASELWYSLPHLSLTTQRAQSLSRTNLTIWTSVQHRRAEYGLILHQVQLVGPRYNTLIQLVWDWKHKIS